METGRVFRNREKAGFAGERRSDVPHPDCWVNSSGQFVTVHASPLTGANFAGKWLKLIRPELSQIRSGSRLTNKKTLRVTPRFSDQSSSGVEWYLKPDPT
jgi:hypothetical protein